MFIPILAQICYFVTIFTATHQPTIRVTPCVAVSPSPSPSPVPTAVPTSVPTPVPTPTLPGPTPSPIPVSTAFPASLLCVHFASNPMCSPLPANPNISQNSNSWAALEFASGRNLGGFQISNAANPYLDNWEDSEPRFELPAFAPSISQTLACDKEAWSAYLCGSLNGKSILVPQNVFPEGDADHHFAFDDFASGGEYDFWEANQPVPGQTLHVGGGGFCRWGGSGTGCSGSTATSIATSLGGVDAQLLQAAESDPVHGTLPYALSASAPCNDASSSYVYPATSSDGDNSNGAQVCAGHTGSGGRPPEGTRWFLAMHDSDVNATNNAPYVKVILRTLDEDHYGGVDTDTNWSGTNAGLQVAFNRGNFAFAAAESGINYGTDVELPITANDIDLITTVKFCTNGTC